MFFPKNFFHAFVVTMKHLPFSVFRRADRPFYSVAFKNEKTGEYLPAISTRKETEAEATTNA
ncbi:hypothetical protein AGMMS49991_08440 [Spirochaetia bacterium]|nr:hypothetical protein AGMMS49991_08440 [Spirochaetia bacterium]